MAKQMSSRARPVTNCPHTDSKHLARGLCGKCYHKVGSGRPPTNCEHRDRSQYAKGLCKNCYLKDYHRIAKEKEKQQQKVPVPRLMPLDTVLLFEKIERTRQLPVPDNFRPDVSLPSENTNTQAVTL